MSETVKILSRMNGKALTVSKGQKKTKPGELLMEAYLGLPEQHFKRVFIKQSFGFQSVSDPTKYIDVPGESTKIY